MVDERSGVCEISTCPTRWESGIMNTVFSSVRPERRAAKPKGDGVRAAGSAAGCPLRFGEVHGQEKR